MLCCNFKSLVENSRTLVDIGILPNHVNLCLDFFLLLFFIFYFILFIIVVHSNKTCFKLTFSGSSSNVMIEISKNLHYLHVLTFPDI